MKEEKKKTPQSRSVKKKTKIFTKTDEKIKKQFLKTEAKSEQERTTIKKRAMIEALKSFLGVVTPACEQAQITRETHYNWLRDDPSYKKEVEGLETMRFDFVENCMIKGIRKGNAALIIFFAKTKMRDRGYIERVDHFFPNEVSIEELEKEAEE
jgi:hypothetical protein